MYRELLERKERREAIVDKIVATPSALQLHTALRGLTTAGDYERHQMPVRAAVNVYLEEQAVDPGCQFTWQDPTWRKLNVELLAALLRASSPTPSGALPRSAAPAQEWCELSRHYGVQIHTNSAWERLYTDLQGESAGGAILIAFDGEGIEDGSPPIITQCTLYVGNALQTYVGPTTQLWQTSPQLISLLESRVVAVFASGNNLDVPPSLRHRLWRVDLHQPRRLISPDNYQFCGLKYMWNDLGIGPQTTENQKYRIPDGPEVELHKYIGSMEPWRRLLPFLEHGALSPSLGLQYMQPLILYAAADSLAALLIGTTQLLGGSQPYMIPRSNNTTKKIEKLRQELNRRGVRYPSDTDHAFLNTPAKSPSQPNWVSPTSNDRTAVLKLLVDFLNARCPSTDALPSNPALPASSSSQPPRSASPTYSIQSSDDDDEPATVPQLLGHASPTYAPQSPADGDGQGLSSSSASRKRKAE